MKTICLLISLLTATTAFNQGITNDSIVNSNRLSSELKAMAIGGGSTFTLVTGFALLINSGLGLDEKIEPAMVPGAGLALSIPSSLLSAGLGYLLGSNHTSTYGGFNLGIGYAGSTVDQKVSQAQDAKNWYHGYQIRVGTPVMGPIRYSMSYIHYESFEYLTFEEPSQSSYWEFNINMHYLLTNGKIEVSPFLGSNIFHQNNIGLYYYDGDRYDESYSDLGFNIGLGISYRLNDRFSIHSEPKLMISADVTQWSFSLASSYEF